MDFFKYWVFREENAIVRNRISGRNYIQHEEKEPSWAITSGAGAVGIHCVLHECPLLLALYLPGMFALYVSQIDLPPMLAFSASAKTDTIWGCEKNNSRRGLHFDFRSACKNIGPLLAKQQHTGVTNSGLCKLEFEVTNYTTFTKWVKKIFEPQPHTCEPNRLSSHQKKLLALLFLLLGINLF